MKKLYWLFYLVLLLVFIGCEKKDDSSTSDSISSVMTSESTQSDELATLSQFPLKLTYAVTHT